MNNINFSSFIVFCAFSMIFNTTAQASDWVNVLKNPVDGMMVAIDTNSVLDKGDGLIEIWQRDSFEYSEPYFDGSTKKQGAYKYQIRHVLIDCRNRKAKDLNVILRNVKNETLTASSVAVSVWTPIVPDTVGQAVMRAGCNRAYGR